MSDHAFLSPSFAHIGYKCAAAALRSFQVNQRFALLREVAAEFYGLDEVDEVAELSKVLAEDNQLANDGTMLHEVFETCMLLKRNPTKDKVVALIKAYDDMSPGTRDDVFIHDQMYRVLMEQRSAVKGADMVRVEAKVKIKGLPDHGTVDLTFGRKRVLHVRDLKTGYGEVSSEYNYQLMTYSVGLLDELGWYEYSHVEIQILGVRWKAEPWVISVNDLRTFKREVMLPSFIAAYAINPSATPGDHCRYCAGKIHCREWQEKFNGFANEYFDSGVVDLDNSGLVRLFKLCKQADMLAKQQLSPELLQRFKGFNPPEGITRVSGAKVKTWKGAEAEVKKQLGAALGKPVTKETLMSPKEVAALAGSDDILDGHIKVVVRSPYLKV